MSEKIVVNLVSSEDEHNITVAPIENKSLYLPFFKEEQHFINNVEYVKFAKNVEHLVRMSREYKAYIAYLKGTVGLRRCMVFGSIDDEKAPVEMHHGPIFTLFDYVELEIISEFRTKNHPVSSFRIADRILQNHFDNVIQVVMLSEAVHLAVHPDPKKKDVKAEFIDIDSAWGDIIEYINRYGQFFSYTHMQKIKRYMKEWEEYKKTPTSKFSVFKEALKKWTPGEFK